MAFSEIRPYFGEYQIRNVEELRKGLKIIRCHGYINKDGKVLREYILIYEIISAPYREEDNIMVDEDSLWIKLRLQESRYDHIIKESLRDHSVIVYRDGLWNTQNWLEYYRDGVVVDDRFSVERDESLEDRVFKYLDGITKDKTFEPVHKEIEKVADSQHKSEITFDDIGGQIIAKKEVMKLAAALNRPERYRIWGAKPPRGICLYGPPGTGKTLFAKALAVAARVPFYNIPSSELMSMWYGQAEKNVDSLFVKARKTSGVIFFDEADALAPSRASDIHEASKRVIAALNRNMDGFVSSDRVVVFFATNRLEDMDKAVLRPGRIDRLIEVPLPDKEGCRQIFEVHKKRAEKNADRRLFEDVDMETILEKMENFSGADVAEIVRRTLESKVEKQDIEGQEPGLVSTDDIIAEIQIYERTKGVYQRIGF